MSDVTLLLHGIKQGNPLAAEELLPIVYNELRRIAASKMAKETPGQTLQPTALVHEAWLRLSGGDLPKFENRAHFFAAAGEAMRRVLIESARRRDSLKRGAGVENEELHELHLIQTQPSDYLLAVHEALDDLTLEDPDAANLVKLRYFVGMTMEEAATALEMPVRSTERLWAYARAWLRRKLESVPASMPHEQITEKSQTADNSAK